MQEASGLFSPPLEAVSFAKPTIFSLTGCQQGSSPLQIDKCIRSGGQTLSIVGADFGSVGATVNVGSVPCLNVTWRRRKRIHASHMLAPSRQLTITTSDCHSAERLHQRNSSRAVRRCVSAWLSKCKLFVFTVPSWCVWLCSMCLHLSYLRSQARSR